MIGWTHRTIVVPAAFVALARSLCAALAPVGGSEMFIVGLSPNGSSPPTHFVSSGLIDAQFAALLPLVDDETTPGQPDVVVALAAEAGITIEQSAIEALFAACDVTEDDPHARIAALGLRVIEGAST